MVNDEDERVQGSSWKGAPDGSAYDSHHDIEELVDNNLETGQDADAMEMQLGSSSSNHQGLDIVQSRISSKFRNSIVVRRQLGLEWIEHQKKHYEFLPIKVNKAPDWENLKDKFRAGPHGVRTIKPVRRKDKGKGRSKDNGKLSI